MPISDLVRRGAVAGALLLTMLAFPAGTAFGAATVELRVLTESEILEDATSYVAGSANVPTDPDADCFFGGQGGSGDPVTLPGPTALGAVKNASNWNDDLLPLSITDEFGFGLGVCAIGGEAADANHFWYLKVNHVEPTTGGDQVKLHNGDTVLWYLAPSNFPNPNPAELTLSAPVRHEPGSFTVTASKWSCTTDFPAECTKSPAQGVSVTNAALPTDSNGNTTVTLNQSTVLRATHSGDMASKGVSVCVKADLDQCPAVRGKTIIGRNKPDDIDGTAGWDVVWSRRGSDMIDIRSGGRDDVHCGNGRHDTVIGVGSKDTIAANCEHRRK